MTKSIQGGHLTENESYPFVAAVYSNVGDATGQRDIIRAEINVEGKSWEWKTDLSYPHTIKSMIDCCGGHVPTSTGGVFGLDTTQESVNLSYIGLKPASRNSRSSLDVKLPTVKGAKCISTTLDDAGFTNILVAGDGILHIASQNAATSSLYEKNHTPAPSIDHATLKGIRKMETAQSGKQLAMFVINGGDNLVCQNARIETDDSVDSIVAEGLPVPLLPAGKKLQSFDAIIQSSLKARHVYCLLEDGSISHLSQCGESKLWTEQALTVPDTETVNDMNTYSCHILFKDETGVPLVNHDVSISTSSQIRCKVNNSSVVLRNVDRAITTNSEGMVSIVMPAPDLTVPDIQITGSAGKSSSFNPAIKAISKLQKAAESGDLSKVKSFKNADAKMCKNIADLSKKFIEKAPKQGEQTHTSTLTHRAASSDAQSNWEFFHGVQSSVAEIKDWFYEAGQFIVKTAEKVWNFIVDMAEHALKALSALLHKIGDAIEDALTWLAEQLDWESILDTMKITNEFFNIGFDMMQYTLEEGGGAVDKVLRDFETQVGQWHTPPSLPAKANESPNADKDKKANSKDHSTNPAFRWASDKAEHTDSGGQAPSSKEESLGSVFKTLYDEIIGKQFDNVENTMNRVWDDIKKVFDPTSELGVQQILQNLGADLVTGFIAAIRLLVSGLVKATSKILELIRKALNAKIEIYVVTKLFKKITHGQDLTVQNLCALLIAVPTTYIIKLVAGKKPREIPQLQKCLDEIDKAKDTVSTSTSSRMAPTSSPVLSNAVSDDQAIPVKHIQLSKRATTTTTSSTPNLTKQADDWMKASFMQRMIYRMRLGMLIADAGVCFYTIYDTVTTGLSWSKLGATATPDDTHSWKKTFFTYTALFMLPVSFPYSKLDFSKYQVSGFTRLCTWFLTNVINIYKSGLPAVLQPVFCAVSGAIDILAYAVILVLEDAKQDEVLAIIQRFLAGGWAIGSAFNGFTKGVNKPGVILTVGVGVALTVDNFIMLKREIDYFEVHRTDENYDHTPWSTSLAGSMG